MRCRFGIAALIVWTVVGWAGQAAAQDPVSYWNQRALEAVAARGATPATIIDMAIVHAAIHDAVQAYDHRFHTYAAAVTGATGSPSVAAAKAARDVLANRFSSAAQVTMIDGWYTTYLASLVPAPSAGDVTGGELAGAAAAANVIVVRTGDGSFPTTFTPFPGGTGVGEWSPNAGATSMVSPWAKDVRPYALDSLDRCEAAPLPLLSSAEWAEAYNEVKAYGAANSTVRTTEQSSIAKTFSGNFLTQYNRLIRDLAAARRGGTDLPSLGDRARLLALTNIAMSDAFVCAWKAKQQFNFWRPFHAIRRGPEDGNILTDPDPNWTTYFSRGNINAAQHPNYPEYTSGANNLTGAMTRMLDLFFDTDKVEFDVYAVAPAVPLDPTIDPDPRHYTKFSDLAKDVIDARVYLGIHYRFADTEARSQGRRVANYTFKNILQPVDKHGNK